MSVPDGTVPHIIVLPGGGYGHHADHEGEPVAQWLRSLDLTASVLHYPVLTRHPGPIDAVRARVAELRADGVERLGILGFSAGGHLAGHAAMSRPGGPSATRSLVDAAILCYPVVSMQLPTHAGSRHTLLGRWAAPWTRRALSVDRMVTRDAPPTFLWHTAEDAAVPVEHTYRLAAALAAHAVPHEVHVYPRGRHGLGLVAGVPDGEQAGNAADWTAACARWLRQLGWVH
ncbi:MAG: xylan esterase [Leifsonia sp.]|nr:xylan esterase [Leifsonia sp.]